MKLIQRRRLGLPIPDPFDTAWEFSKGEMSLEKSVFDWFNPAIQANRMPTQQLHSRFDPQAARHAAMLESMKTNATPEVKPQKLLDDGISAMPLLGTGHEEHDPGLNDYRPDHHTITEDEAKERVAEEEWREKERAAIRRVVEYPFGEDLPESVRRILEGDFSNYEIETKDNVVADIPFVADIPDANLSDIDPEVVMPDKPKTVTEEIKAARKRTKKTVEDVLNSGMITGPETTPKSVIEELHGMVEDGDEDATKLFYNNQDTLVREHGYDKNHEFFQKSIQTIVENPFANPFYDMSAFSIKKERPKGFVAPPAFTPPIDLIKQEQPNAIEGFETNEGDDLSLLPSSVFKNTDAPVVDNMSLLPTGWKNE